MNGQTGIKTARAAAPALLEDYSADFNQLRAILQGDTGLAYREALQQLKPRYARVWMDIALGYLMLGASCAAAAWLASRSGPWPFAAFAMQSVLVGYWVAYIQLFIHEASHFNIAPSRKANDLLGDALIGWLVGTTMQKYRKIHFQHHRALGTTGDSEHTYFFPLDAWFVLKGLTGWRAIEVLMSRKSLHEAMPEPIAAPALFSRESAVLLGGIAAHLAIVALLYLLAGWAPALGWVAGVGAVFPFLGALRQLLEHRDDAADPGTDYRLTDHGAHTRMFGSGPFSSTFGAAGFNRHLLHHWEPQVSYTRLAELEALLARTSLAAIIDNRRTSYGATFCRLFGRA